MATLQIDIPDQQAAALKAYALVRGLTVEQCVVQLVEQAAPLAERSAPFEQELARDPKRPIWEVIAERMQALPDRVRGFYLLQNPSNRSLSFTIVATCGKISSSRFGL